MRLRCSRPPKPQSSKSSSALGPARGVRATSTKTRTGRKLPARSAHIRGVAAAGSVREHAAARPLHRRTGPSALRPSLSRARHGLVFFFLRSAAATDRPFVQAPTHPRAHRDAQSPPTGPTLVSPRRWRGRDAPGRARDEHVCCFTRVPAALQASDLQEEC